MGNRSIRLSAYTLLVLLLSCLGLQLESDVLSAKQTDSGSFYQDFTEDTLEDWFWVREDPTQWSLFTRPGYLRIMTQNGTLDEDNTIENLLLHEAPTESFALSTRLEFTPTAKYHEASLFLYADDDNYIKLSRLYSDSPSVRDIYFLQQEVGGVRVKGFTAAATEAVTELTLRVDERAITGLYKNSGGEWVSLGQFAPNADVTYPFVGISAYHGINRKTPSAIAVDFDYIKTEIIQLTQLFLPHIQR